MEKILVTTDLSKNSGSALRFAHKLCLLRGASLVILYVDESPIPTGWSEREIEAYKSEKKNNLIQKVEHFITVTLRSINKPQVSIEIVIEYSSDTVKTISNCAETYNCLYICISTHGAGKIKRIIGTHTSQLMAKAHTPVLCIPSTYRVKKIDRVCYASDMKNYRFEIEKVLQFSMPIGAALELLHIAFPIKFRFKKDVLKTELRELTGEDININFIERDISNSLHTDINLALKKMQPSMVVFFSKRPTTFFDKLVHPSTAQALSFSTKIPILSFMK